MKKDKFKFKAGQIIRHKITGQEFFIKGIVHNGYSMQLLGTRDPGTGNVDEVHEFFEKKVHDRKQLKL